MPVYDYWCQKCDKSYEVTKSIKLYDGRDQCPDCGNVGNREFSCKVAFLGASVEDAEYNVGLGQVTKGKRHREELANRLGLIEVGSEDPNRLHDSFEKHREEKRAKSWESIDNEL